MEIHYNLYPIPLPVLKREIITFVHNLYSKGIDMLT